MSKQKKVLVSIPEGQQENVKDFVAGVKVPILGHYGDTDTPTRNTYRESMDDDYKHFRFDEIVRRCIVVNAMFTVLAAGFETELEAKDEDLPEEQKQALLEKYGFIKDYVDSMNKKVNVDNVVFVSQVKRSIYGKSAWEKIFVDDTRTTVSWLLSLPSTKIRPNIGKGEHSWELLGYKYNNKSIYKTDDLLYFTNLELEADHEGLSDIEPVRDVCEARYHLMHTDIKEITKRLWAPLIIHYADTSGITGKTEKQAFLDNLTSNARAGKSVAVNQQVTSTVVNITPDINGLVLLMKELEDAIMRQFGVPKFLLGKEVVNRATAYTEYEAYIEGVIASNQRYFKRELERQWYPELIKQALTMHGETVENCPVTIKHKWNKIRTSDVYAMGAVASGLYANGLGLLGSDPETAYDLMGLDKTRLEEQQQLERDRLEEQKRLVNQQ